MKDNYIRFRAGVTVALVPDGEHVLLKETQIDMEVQNYEKNKSVYELENGMPTRFGAEMITQALVAGLVANIHYCHREGYLDNAKHLRGIIESLENGFGAILTDRDTGGLV